MAGSILLPFFLSGFQVMNQILSIYDKHTKKITDVLYEKMPACRYIKKEELFNGFYKIY